MQSDARTALSDHLDPLTGSWEIEATHRLMPGEVIRGRATLEWLPGKRVLIWRSDYVNPEIPDSISILSCGEMGESAGISNPDERCQMHYVDQRGVIRNFHFTTEPGMLRAWRDWPGFSQRFTHTLSSDANTLSGVAELRQDDATWEEDMLVTLRRVS